jgi:hypothetical protein
VATFADNLAQLISGGGDSGPGGSPAAASAPASDAGSQETKPELNGTPPTAAPSPTVTAPAPAQADDSLNLIRLVGPAILKRVAPIAAAIAVLVIAGSWLRRRGTRKD